MITAGRFSANRKLVRIKAWALPWKLAAIQSSLSSTPILILAALVAVYLILGMLYESTIHPLTIISTLPSAGLGALLTLMLFGMPLDVIGIIGGVPLMLGTGTGSEIRQPLGYAIVGGLLVSQLLTLFTTPIVYIYMDRVNGWLYGRPSLRSPDIAGTSNPQVRLDRSNRGRGSIPILGRSRTSSSSTSDVGHRRRIDIRTMP
jgi:hypothetical protein